MDTLEIVLIAAAAVVAIAFAARSASKARQPEQGDGEPRPTAATASPAGSELIAVIAAAVAAESGMELGSFRVAGINAVGAQGSVGGFNTPPWGFADRIARAARN